MKVRKKIYGIRLFYGEDRNLFKRYISCMKKYNFKHFVRVTGDNPFTDIFAINKISKEHIKNRNDYTYTSGLIRGTKPEIFSLKSLITCNNLSVDPLSSEYLTFYYLRETFRIQKLNFKKKIDNQNKISISIDTPKHLVNLKKLLKIKMMFILKRNCLLKKLILEKKIFYTNRERYVYLKNKKFNVSLKNDPKNLKKIDLKNFGII